MRLTDVADTEQLFRLIQSIWEVAKIAHEQLEMKIGKSVISHRSAKDFLQLPEEWKMKNFQFSTFNFQLQIIRVNLCQSVGLNFSPTDSTDFHGFGYMLSVFICDISGKYFFLPRICFLGSLPALGIGAASFWSVSGKRYSGKPDGLPERPH